MHSIAVRNKPTLSHTPPSPPGSSQYSTLNNKSPPRPWNNALPRGLCTPPADENMGTTYEVPRLPSCENYPLYHSSSAYVPTMPQPDRLRARPNEQIFDPISRYPAPLPSQTQKPRSAAPAAHHPAGPTTALSAMPSSTSGTEYPQGHDASRQPRQRTPPSAKSTGSAASAKMTHHSMSIPERISPRGGSISDFMAEVAALFWFDSIKLLEKVEKMPKLGRSASVQPLAPPAVASQHFKKWVSTVLTTTQVTQNVVILALLYIYRLKKANPTVKGRPGSEYRLLTVALMLGNKFLDDNTYTNKTWADVSGISVNEIHVMEVEFLSNMRYSLLVSADEWEQWLDKLAKFWSYLELAQQARSPTPSPLLIPSPTHRSFASPLHSPIVPLTPGLQSATHSFALQSPNLPPSGSNSQNWQTHYGGSHAASPVAPNPEPQLYRKRSFYDEDSVEPPAKRMSRIPVGQIVPSQAQLPYPSAAPPPQALPNPPLPAVAPVLSRPVPAPDHHVRPQVPSLTLNTAQAAGVPVTQAQPYATSAYAPQQPPLSLPPLASGARAMSMVYPTTTYAPPQAIPATCGTVTPTASFPPMSYGTPTKRLSPQNTLSAFPGSSPLVMANGSASGLHTPISHSPSIYLQQRNSPYKPVRHVNTLLYPPPSAFLQQYQLPNPVLPNQMHYQPLGKRNEYRTGIVPEFLTGAHRFAPAPVVANSPYHAQQPVGQVLPNPQYPHVHQPREAYQPPLPARHAAPYPGPY